MLKYACERCERELYDLYEYELWQECDGGGRKTGSGKKCATGTGKRKKTRARSNTKTQVPFLSHQTWPLNRSLWSRLCCAAHGVDPLNMTAR